MMSDPITHMQPPPPNWADAPLDPAYWWIDLGPFCDRLDTYGGAGTQLAVTSSTDATVQGIYKIMALREYIDLKRPDVAGMLALLGTKIAALSSGAVQANILTARSTNYERHVKGMVQPS